jgi:hypothetical protein
MAAIQQFLLETSRMGQNSWLWPENEPIIGICFGSDVSSGEVVMGGHFSMNGKWHCFSSSMKMVALIRVRTLLETSE